MAKKPTYTHAPYGPDGNLLDHPNAYIPHTGAIEWREIVPFPATLTLQYSQRGRSSAVFIWTDRDDRKYPMFLTDMVKLATSTVIDHGTVEGTWTVVKRGQNYGIALC